MNNRIDMSFPKQLIYFLFIALVSVVLATGPATAYDCDSARLAYENFQRDLKEVQQTINTKTREIERLETKIKENNLKTDNNIYTMRQKHKEALQNYNKASQERTKLSNDCTNEKFEIDEGLFCSECKRSMSAIKKEDGQEFDVHLKKVKGHGVSKLKDPELYYQIQKEAYNKLSNKCKQKGQELSNRKDQLFKQSEGILDNINKIADDNLKTNIQIRQKIDAIQSEISLIQRQASPRMINGSLAEVEMKENGCVR